MSLAAPRSADARPAPRTGPGGAAVWRLGLWWTACVAASIADILRLRLDVVDLAVAATRLEATLTGGRGYASASPTARRLREAAFLPIQSPSEGHLRWELSSLTSTA